MPARHALLFAFAVVSVCTASAFAAEAGIVVEPTTVKLEGNFAQAQVRVEPKLEGNRRRDLTHAATYEIADPAVATVNEFGRLVAVGNGATTLKVTADGVSASIPVEVSGVEAEPHIGFREMVSPILSRAGCNQGACHASQYGKGGFVLSVFGFEPSHDYESIVRDRHQRRVNLLDPEDSLFLKKPTMRVPHGGGQRLRKGSPDHAALVAWLRCGAPAPRDEAAKVVGLEVSPVDRVSEPGETLQMRAVATYSDGRVRDVTGWARYDSLDEGVLSINEDGKIEVIGRGQAPVMVRFEGQAQIANVMAPYGPEPELADWESQNFVDELAVQKFRELGIEPSPVCDDATFIRRAFLDATGTLPTPEETVAFLEDSSPDKRTQLIDRLLGLTGDPALDIYNDRYAATWTLKWSDLLRNTSNGQAADEQRMWAMHNWIKEAFRVNRPFDQFVREIVTAKGSIYSSGPASYYRINTNAPDLAETTAQLFLGVRLQCAKCHHHPFENYSQADYYSFAAFFARIGTKNSEEFGLFGRESVVIVRNSGDVRHPKTGQVLKPRPLGGDEVEHELDRRIPLAEWLTSAENIDFARSVANRYVSYLLGRGLVEPVDDMRATNPASNPELLNRLAQHFVESDFNLKQLMRVIMTSRLYQLSSQPTANNLADSKFYSHFPVKRIAAEPLLDAVDFVTGSPTKFKNLPLGTRAIELPDGEYPNYFLNVFAKPRRASVCECERLPDENLAQALHTLNGDVLASKIGSTSGRIAELLKQELSDEEVLSELYLAALCRRPTEEEQEALLPFLKESPSRQEFFEDVLWGLLNSKQFLFVY